MSAPEPSSRTRSLTLLASAAILVAILAAILYWTVTSLLPEFLAWVDAVFSPGLGLRTAAIVSAVVSFAALIFFALAAGDGLLGEIQFMIPGFFAFFLFFWLMTAWVF